MTIPVLLTGILIAMGVFVALGWSAAQALRGRGRAANLAQGALILLGMALISLELPNFGRIAGAALLLAALWAAALEDGWSRLIPLFGAAFGAALLLGLPFAGG